MIESLNAQNLEELLPVIQQYQSFYGVENLSDDTNRKFFSQFDEHSQEGCVFVYRAGGVVAGFATIYFSYASTLAAKVAILNDLFTLPDYRGNGIARKLIEHSRLHASEKGAVRLQWLTAPDNRQAQAVYDALQASSSTWRCYIYPTQLDRR
jgi:GNAT superfamily N-acetyltransferase